MTKDPLQRPRFPDIEEYESAPDIAGSTGGGSGSGDVTGPSSATDGEIPEFDGTTGKIIRGSGYTILSLLAAALAAAGVWFFANSGSRAPVRLTTIAALPAHTRSTNTLTASANGALTVDGTSAAVNDRILVRHGTGPEQGVYVVTAAGSAGSTWSMTRSDDMNETAEFAPGVFFDVYAGGTMAGTVLYQSTTAAVTVNTTTVGYALLVGPRDNDRSVQFRNADAFSGAASTSIDTSGYPNISGVISEPSVGVTPTSGSTLISRSHANQAELAVIDAFGNEYMYMPSFETSFQAFKIGGGVGTSVNDSWGTQISEFGTATQINTGTADIVAQLPVRRYQTTTTGAGVSAGARSNLNGIIFRGNAAGAGGFRVHVRWYVDSFPTNARFFVGVLQTTSSTLINGTDPSALTNVLGVGADAGDTNLSALSNDGSGAATKTAFGTPSNFPASNATSSYYDMWIGMAPNSATAYITLRRRTTSGTVYAETITFSSNTPAANTFLNFEITVGTGTGSGTAANVYFSNYYSRTMGF